MNKHELTINYNIVNSKFYKNYTFLPDISCKSVLLGKLEHFEHLNNGKFINPGQKTLINNFIVSLNLLLCGSNSCQESSQQSKYQIYWFNTLVSILDSFQ